MLEDLAIGLARRWPMLAGRRRGYRLMDRLLRATVGRGLRGLRWVEHGGVEIEYDLDNYHERLMAYELQGEEGFAFLRVLLRRGDVFVDCGANAGMYSAAAASIVGKSGAVFSIEANPALASRLHGAAERNRDRVGKWIVIENALADEEKRLAFHLSAMPMWSSAMPLADGEAPAGQVDVQAVTLDTLAPQFGKVRLMKIDIEGSECLALRGARAWLASGNSPDYVLSECNDPVLRRFGNSAEELIGLLEAAGYRPHRMFWRTRARPGATPLEKEWRAGANFDLLFVHERVAGEGLL